MYQGRGSPRSLPEGILAGLLEVLGRLAELLGDGASELADDLLGRAEPEGGEVLPLVVLQVVAGGDTATDFVQDRELAPLDLDDALDRSGPVRV